MTFPQNCLHITNGDSVVSHFKEIPLVGRYLPWRDVLYRGSCPVAVFWELDPIRESFLLDSGWADPDEIRRYHRERQEVLRGLAGFDEICLWFEHDLYDQLQIWQIGHFLKANLTADTKPALSMVIIGEFPGIEPFYGLGMCSPNQLHSLVPQRVPIPSQLLGVWSQAWCAFTSNSPEPWLALLNLEAPFLKSNVERLLQELPGKMGFSRTESQILELLREEEQTPVSLYKTQYTLEAVPFHGNHTFFDILKKLMQFGFISSAEPNDAFDVRKKVVLTRLGRDLLEGKQSWSRGESRNSWLGGVPLGGPGPIWRWIDGRLEKS